MNAKSKTEILCPQNVWEIVLRPEGVTQVIVPPSRLTEECGYPFFLVRDHRPASGTVYDRNGVWVPYTEYPVSLERGKAHGCNRCGAFVASSEYLTSHLRALLDKGGYGWRGGWVFPVSVLAGAELDGGMADVLDEAKRYGCDLIVLIPDGAPIPSEFSTCVQSDYDWQAGAL